MNRKLASLAVIGSLFAALAASPAVAQNKKMMKTRNMAVTGVTGGVVTGGGKFATAEELTAQECKGLGGSVSDTPAGDPQCSTKQMCFTTDKHGVIRAQCIDEVAAD